MRGSGGRDEGVSWKGWGSQVEGMRGQVEEMRESGGRDEGVRWKG